MPTKCCVAKCETNYGYENRKSIFKFPTDQEIKRKCLRNIRRYEEDINFKSMGVCSLHFESRFIKEFNEFGSTIVPLNRLRLLPEACPTIFDGVPCPLSSAPRKNPNIRAEEILQRERDKSFQKMIKEIKENEIVSFDDLRKHFIEKPTLMNWQHSIAENTIDIFKLKKHKDGSISIDVSININNELEVKLFHKSILSKSLKVNQWSQIQKIINQLDNDDCIEEETIKSHLQRALEILLAIKDLIENDAAFEYKNVVDVIADQIVQMLQHGTTRKFSNNTILIAYIIYLQSAKTYEIIRNKNILILPHTATLRKITTSQDVNADNFESNNKYLRKIIENIAPINNLVVLEIDEIYLDCRLAYKAKSLRGAAENTDEMAKTLTAFLVNSCFGNGLKDIVRLLPTTNIFGDELKKYTWNVIDQLQALNLKVVGVVTDNNKVNRRMFILFDPSFKFDNPMYFGQTIKCFFDTVHIVKNIRNNWLNKTDQNKSFFYPDFEDYDIVRIAHFKDLRELYNTEVQTLKLLKKAPKLNKKTLYPTSFERQRVPYVMNLIHDTTISALKTFGFESTAVFLEIIQKWYNIVNNRSTIKGQIKRCKWQEWLEAWASIDKKLKENGIEGGLTKETSEAAIITTKNLIYLIKESFESYDIDYFLPGKFQSEDVESRFRRYRQLSGCNYYVFHNDILESEKKLLVKKIVKNFDHELVRKCHGTVKKVVDIQKFLIVLNTEYLSKFCAKYDTAAAFLYVSGYGGHAATKKISCEECRKLIVLSKGEHSELDYFENLQRGGLIQPTDLCKYILFHMNALIDELMGNDALKHVFLSTANQKEILIQLTYASFLSDNYVVNFENDTCFSCNRTYSDIFSPVFSTFANILLNNLSKFVADKLVSDKKQLVLNKLLKKKETEKNNETENHNNNENEKETVHRKTFITQRKRKAEVYSKSNKLIRY